MNANGVHDPGNDQFGETCSEPGHVHGCPGMAGGDHELVERLIDLTTVPGRIEAAFQIVRADLRIEELEEEVRHLKAELASRGDWFEDDEGYVRAPLSYENREGEPAFNGAFSKW
jgi:hypothetical protein